MSAPVLGLGGHPDDLPPDDWWDLQQRDYLLQDYEPLPIQGVILSPHQIDQALEWSQVARNEVQQWRLYRQGLALLGVEQWLHEREPSLMLGRGCGTIPIELPLLTAVTNVQVGSYRLCLLPRGGFADPEIEIPKAVVDLPDFVPHFYVVVEIQEELNCIRVAEVLRYDCLVQSRQMYPFRSTPSDWTYAVPLAWFTADADQLLLWLCCLEAVALPLVAEPEIAPAPLHEALLEPLLPNLHASDELWPVLSWPQGIALLQNPTLRQWLTQALHAGDWVQLSDSQPLGALPEPERPPWLRPINTALWMQQVLEDVAREWVLLSPTLALRSRPPAIIALLATLRQRDVVVPDHAGIAYRELGLDGTFLRLYTLVWPLEEPDPPEWTLLLVLGPQPDTELQHSVQLIVRDVNQILINSVLTPESADLYLYTQVVGTWDEQFWVTLGFDFDCSATAIQLAPFRFEPPSS